MIKTKYSLLSRGSGEFNLCDKMLSITPSGRVGSYLQAEGGKERFLMVRTFLSKPITVKSE